MEGKGDRKGQRKRYKQKYPEKVKAYAKARGQKNKNFLKEFKKGKSCEQCGYNTDSRILVFHHKNRENKKFELNTYGVRSLETIKKEIDKCILLCPNCHHILHLKENAI
jgi:hypothetical protein